VVSAVERPDQVGGFDIYTGAGSPVADCPSLIFRTPENRPVSYRRTLYRRQPMAARLVVEVTRQMGRGRTCPESKDK
jgi:hypothetical protein